MRSIVCAIACLAGTINKINQLFSDFSSVNEEASKTAIEGQNLIAELENFDRPKPAPASPPPSTNGRQEIEASPSRASPRKQPPTDVGSPKKISSPRKSASASNSPSVSKPVKLNRFQLQEVN